MKSLVGRLRPVAAQPVDHGTGNSFPGGHSLGSIACYGAVFLVFLPAARGRWRTVCTTVIVALVALVALIGISRILLGVYYVSDVIGGWTIGITWLGLTAFAFEVTRQAAGLPVNPSRDRRPAAPAVIGAGRSARRRRPPPKRAGC